MLPDGFVGVVVLRVGVFVVFVTTVVLVVFWVTVMFVVVLFTTGKALSFTVMTTPEEPEGMVIT